MIVPLSHWQPATAVAVHTLQQAAYALEAALIGYPDLPPLRESITAIQQSTETFWGVYEEGTLLGLLAYETGAATYHISRLGVAPHAQRRGIARRLLDHVVQQAPRPSTLTVSTAVANTPAIALYRRVGFTPRSRTYLPDGLVLVTLARSLSAQAQ